MNGANHQMNAVTTFPFYTLEGWEQVPPTQNDLPIKGDTVIGNDVWKRFDDELIEVMEKLKWWDKSIEEINNLIPILTSSDLEKVKEELSKLV